MMVGEGPEKLVAERMCEDLGISDKVIFFGNSNDIDQILKYSDLFLLPSETESFGSRYNLGSNLYFRLNHHPSGQFSVPGIT